jgi:hypothetical protein
MGWPLGVVGAALVLVALTDIFRTLWHPRGFGGLARGVFTTVWRVTRPLSRGDRSSEVAGPLALVLTVVVWTSLIVLGWGLVYLPTLPDGFRDTGDEPGVMTGLATAIYVSLVSLGTLGLGDIAPVTPWLRILVPLQALVGFILLTAAISWVLELYPALARRRALARRLSGLARTDTRPIVLTGDRAVAAGLLDRLTDDVLAVHVDLIQHGESYFFREEMAGSSLAATGCVLIDLSETGRQAAAPEVRHAAEMLALAIVALTDDLAKLYLHVSVEPGDQPALVMQALAADHQHEPLRLTGPA